MQEIAKLEITGKSISWKEKLRGGKRVLQAPKGVLLMRREGPAVLVKKFQASRTRKDLPKTKVEERRTTVMDLSRVWKTGSRGRKKGGAHGKSLVGKTTEKENSRTSTRRRL